MFSLQHLVQRGLEELSCGCFYEVGECAEWPSEGNDPTAYWDWWSMMPLCHAGLHLLYPLRINTSLVSEYKGDIEVVSRKHLSSYNKPALRCDSTVANFTLINWMFGCSGDRLVVLSHWWFPLDWFVNFEATLMPQVLFHVLQAAPEWYLWCLRQHVWEGGHVSKRNGVRCPRTVICIRFGIGVWSLYFLWRWRPGSSWAALFVDV